MVPAHVPACGTFGSPARGGGGHLMRGDTWLAIDRKRWLSINWDRSILNIYILINKWKKELRWLAGATVKMTKKTMLVFD